MNAKKHGFGAITIMILMFLVAFSSMLFIMNPEQVKAAAIDYGYYKQLTIESDYISATLTNFPILVHDNTGDLLGNVLNDGSDIAFYTSDNVTQYNHEIEEYNSTTGELIAWVNITSLSHSADTVLYMYYNDSDGGYGIGHNPTDTWDSNYLAVWHMNNASDGQLDSTSQHDAIEIASYEPIYQQTGKCGYAIDFESTNADQLNVTIPSTLDGLSAITIESWTNRESSVCPMAVVTCTNGQPGGDKYAWLHYQSTATCIDDFSSGPADTSASSSYTSGDHGLWIYIAANWTAGSKIDQYNNGTWVDDSAATLASMRDNADMGVKIGGYGGNTKWDDTFDGLIDEVRISNVARSVSWISTSYNSQNQTTGFLTFGSEQAQGDSSSYSIKGLYDSQVTWSGTADNTVWCNDTGDHYEWLEINMSINASQNITDILVWVSDLNNTGSSEWINASNITLYVSADNISYGSLGAFTDGGSNISINKTTWPSGAGTNPFDGTGLTDNDTSIYLIFKTAIPATVSTADFWASSGTAYKIYLGRYT